MPTIVRDGQVLLKVYPGERSSRHKAPHFHVVIGGEDFASVRLSDLEPFIGGPLPRKVDRLCEEHWESLWEAWDEYNPSD